MPTPALAGGGSVGVVDNVHAEESSGLVGVEFAGFARPWEIPPQLIEPLAVLPPDIHPQPPPLGVPALENRFNQLADPLKLLLDAFTNSPFQGCLGGLPDLLRPKPY